MDGSSTTSGFQRGIRKPPTKVFLDKVQSKARNIAKTRCPQCAELFIRASLVPWPELIAWEISVFKETSALQ